jgi:hypothetical protein
MGFRKSEAFFYAIFAAMRIDSNRSQFRYSAPAGSQMWFM